MAKVERLNDFQNGTRADAEQVDAEFDNLVQAHNHLDDEVKQKVSVDGDFQGTWNGVAFEEADPAIAGRVTKMEQMVKEEDPVTITLKRGENLIEAPEYVTFTPIEVLGDEVKNLALDFDHWELHENAVKNSPDRVTLNAGTAKEASILKVDVKRNQDYVYSMKHTGSIAVLDANLSENAIAPYTSESFLSFNSSNHTSIHIVFKNKNDESGTFTFEGPMLVEGTKEREFVQNYQPIRGAYIEVDNGSYVYFDEYLYKGDKIYQDAKGNWRKKQNVIESILTPENVKNPTINTSYTGGKAIKIPLTEIAKGIDIFQTEFIKFNRTFLVQTDSAANITNDRYYLDDEYLLLFVSSDDTGWADDYEPTRVDVHAFLLGWKKETDKWTRLTGEGETTTLPQASYHGWNPFKLIYHTTSEQDAPAKYEGSLRLSKGGNIVTLGEGVVLREKANPVLADGKYHIGSPTVSGSETAFTIDQALEVVKQGKKDEWELTTHTELEEALYNPNALYEITYKVKNAFAYTCYVGDTEASYAPNFHMESNEQARELQELKNKVTQHELAVVDKLGKKNGIVLHDEEGFPLRPNGIRAGVVTEFVQWTDVSTNINSGKTYEKRIPLKVVPEYVRYQIGSANSSDTSNDSAEFYGTLDMIKKDELIKTFLNPGPDQIFWSSFQYTSLNKEINSFSKYTAPFRGSARNAGSYIDLYYKGFDLDTNEMVLKFKNVHPSTTYKLNVILLLEVRGFLWK